ncbi:MAG: methylmalonyl Co-A mutase-associated GTPase MeaB [Cytophagales bacterium]|nr:MAG: methylmalonyl Co-A mutase-associated GTPase MeaB [Cytophagales bacterium]
MEANVPRRSRLSLSQYQEGVLAGDVITLSRAITLIESRKEEDRALSGLLLEGLLPYSKDKNCIRIGITGVPGVGKSTFIETFGMHLIEEVGLKLAVLAVDPSSERSRGSILGDKTRMAQLAAHPRAYIRPSPSQSTLGGIAKRTREVMFLCQVAGYEVILVETVGVGQSETMVSRMTDFFLLLMLAGAGDELQGIKKGIMEMADLIAITKADGENKLAAQRAKAEYKNALHLFPPKSNGWFPEVITCSALQKEGIVQIWEMIEKFALEQQKKGFWIDNRSEQNVFWLKETIRETLESSFYAQPTIQEHWQNTIHQVATGAQDISQATNFLIDLYRKSFFSEK